MHMRRVVLPQPLGPSRAYTVPALTSRLRLSRTWKRAMTRLTRMTTMKMILMTLQITILLALVNLEIVVASHCSFNNESWSFEKRSRHLFFLRSSLE